MALLVARIVNNPTLTKYLCRYLTHLGDGLLVGNPNTRIRDQLINHVRDNVAHGRYTIAWADPQAPQCWTYTASTPLPTLDGLILARSQNSNNVYQTHDRT